MHWDHQTQDRSDGSKPFKVRPRNIPSGLLEEVKDHLDHMLDVGAITPSKSVWSNAVVLVWKRMWDLHQFSKAKCSNLKGHLSTPLNT